MATDELSGKPDEMLEGNLVMKLHPGRSSDTPSRISSCWINEYIIWITDRRSGEVVSALDS